LPKQVAAGRILHCLNADAQVTVVCPAAGLNPEVAHRVAARQVRHVDRPFAAGDIADADPPPALVLCAVDEAAPSAAATTATNTEASTSGGEEPPPSAETVSDAVARLCRARGIPVNVADVPASCDFYFGSVLRDGPLQVVVSTNGEGPRMAALVRRWIARNLPAGVGAATARVGLLRRRVRVAAPAPRDSGRRMKWVSTLCDRWSLEDLAGMSEEDMLSLMEYFKRDEVPTLQQVRWGGEGEAPPFDGSFGWWI
jgi:precorrin-2 dehydrogenase/sirohydrochlorin ferrochelatase